MMRKSIMTATKDKTNQITSLMASFPITQNKTALLSPSKSVGLKMMFKAVITNAHSAKRLTYLTPHFTPT